MGFYSKKKMQIQKTAHLRALEFEPEESLEDLFILYGEEIGKILKGLGKDMTAVQERIVELANKFGVRERISKEEYEKGLKLERKKVLKTAIHLRKAGMNLDFISKIVELPELWLERFFKKVKVQLEKRPD